MVRIGSEDGRLVNGRYRLVEVIGRGGMGTVWHGHDELLDREVAIKEIRLPPELDDEERSLLSERAMREARATARLSHPGIITVYDVIEHDGAPMIVMEYIDGRSLADLLKEKVRLPWRRTAEIGAIMLGALRVAHAAGVVHRDLKPANVLLSGDRVIITDFGIAHRSGETTLSEPGELIGTPAFMAPEQAEHATVTPASDLWSLGATLFAAVEGRPPYAGPDFATILLSVLTQEPAQPRAAGPLSPVIGSLLRKNPARRATAEQVATALEKILRDAAAPPAPAPSTPGPVAPTRSVPARPSPRPKPFAPVGLQPYPRRPAQAANGPTAADKRFLRGTGFLLLVLVGATFALVVTLAVISPSSSSPAPAAVPTRPTAPSAISSTPPIDLTSIDSMTVSGDGSTVAVASTKESGVSAVRLWSATGHTLLGTLPTRAFAMAFSDDHKTLATVDDVGNFGLWNIATHRREQAASLPFYYYQTAALTFSPDGRTVVFAAAADDYTAELATWRLGTTTVRATPILGSCDSIAISRDAATVACVPGYREDAPEFGDGLQLWSVATHQPGATLPTAPATAVYALDGNTLAAVGTDGSIALSDMVTQQRTAVLPPDGSRVQALAFDARGELADVDDKGVIRVWDATTHRQIAHWSAGES